jgi:hypothetical protein
MQAAPRDAATIRARPLCCVRKLGLHLPEWRNWQTRRIQNPVG